MNKLCKLFFSIILLSALIFLCQNIFAESAPPEVLKAAEKGLTPFLNMIPQEEKEYYGFADSDNLSEAYLGDPFRVYTITPSNILASTQASTIESVITPTQMWSFPIMIKGDIKALLTVDRVDGLWQAVTIGQAPLGKELKKISDNWPKSKGYDPLLIAVFQTKQYFFTVPQKDKHNLTAIFPVDLEVKGVKVRRESAPADYSSTKKLSESINILKKTVKDNAEQ